MDQKVTITGMAMEGTRATNAINNILQAFHDEINRLAKENASLKEQLKETDKKGKGKPN